MATQLLNITSSTAIHNQTPFSKLYQKPTKYTHLKVFGCICYPQIPSPHKLATRSTPCVFLGYLSHHHGFRCFDLTTRKILISHHVIFDESTFPFISFPITSTPTYNFLDYDTPPTHLASRLLSSPPPTQPTYPVIDSPTPIASPPPVTPETFGLVPSQPEPPTSLGQASCGSSLPLSHPTDMTKATAAPDSTPGQPLSSHPMVTRRRDGM